MKKISFNEKPYIIAEIGANHNGDINLAIKLIDEAKKLTEQTDKLNKEYEDFIKISNNKAQEMIINERKKLNTEFNKKQDELIEINKSFEGITHEAGLLKLNCDKVLAQINWKPVLEFEETITFTTNWYKEYYLYKNNNMFEYSLEQIAIYTELANLRDINWAN